MKSHRELGLMATAQTNAQGGNTGIRTVQYQVTGLPRDQQAWVGLSANNGWRYLRERSGIRGAEWRGNYTTAEEASLALRKELGYGD